MLDAYREATTLRRSTQNPYMKLQKPIFILGPHKSGTSLLRALLDSHPELAVLPYETHLFDLAGYWVDYRFRRSAPSKKSLDEIRQAYFQLAVKYNSTTNRMADAQLRDQLDLDVFSEKLSNHADGFEELIPIYFNAIYASIFGRDLPPTLRVVEKSVEHTEFAMDLAHLFPDAKFLHILRNPYSNIVALRRLIQSGRKSYPFLRRIICSLQSSYFFLYRNARVLSNYKIVKYEDLLRNPEGVLKSVTDFLEIEYTPTLLKPSSIGRDWDGNSSRGISFAGISDSNLDIWRNEIKHLEVHYVNRFFPFILDDFGYEYVHPSQNISTYIASERPHIYLLNRLLPKLI